MKRYLDPEGRRVGWLLTELERQTADRLSEESRQSLLDEVVCHLDAAIQARLELGMTMAEAEIEAVETFGHPKAYVDDLLRVHEQAQAAPRPRANWIKGDRPTTIAFLAITLFGFSWVLGYWHKIEVAALSIGFAVLVPVFAYFSFKARRIQPIPIAISSVMAYVVLVFGITMMSANLWTDGGNDLAPRWRVQAENRI